MFFCGIFHLLYCPQPLVTGPLIPTRGHLTKARKSSVNDVKPGQSETGSCTCSFCLFVFLLTKTFHAIDLEIPQALIFVFAPKKKKRFKYISINNWGYSLVNHSLCTVLLILITWQLTGVHFTYVGMICFHIASFWPCHSINIVLVSMDGEWQIGREQRWAGPGAAVHMRMKGSVYSD